MTVCSLCGEQMMVMPGPEEGEVTYDYESKRVYHKQCLLEYKEFVAYYMLFHGITWCELVQVACMQAEQEV